MDASPGLIDALVTGPFENNQRQTLALRGSDNQELHFLTAMGRARFASFQRPSPRLERTLDVMFDDRGDVWFAGIPASRRFPAFAGNARERRRDTQHVGRQATVERRDVRPMIRLCPNCNTERPTH